MEHRIHIDAQTTLFVETTGEGENLLLLPGMASGNWIWRQNVGALAQRFHLIMPEFRGSGRSDKPDEHYSIAQFSYDIAIVLQSLAISQTHILGLSMGGFVAQHLAAHSPHLVEKLVLVSTSLGGQCQHGPDGKVLSRLIRPHGKTRHDRFLDGFKLNFSPEFMLGNEKLLQEIIAWRMHRPQPEYAYYRQLLAGNAWNGYESACQIEAETLVCAAENDPIVPAENAKTIAAAIANSQVLLFPGYHLFFFEHARVFNETIMEFLTEPVKLSSLAKKYERSKT